MFFDSIPVSSLSDCCLTTPLIEVYPSFYQWDARPLFWSFLFTHVMRIDQWNSRISRTRGVSETLCEIHGGDLKQCIQFLYSHWFTLHLTSLIDPTDYVIIIITCCLLEVDKQTILSFLLQQFDRPPFHKFDFTKKYKILRIVKSLYACALLEWTHFSLIRSKFSHFVAQRDRQLSTAFPLF